MLFASFFVKKVTKHAKNRVLLDKNKGFVQNRSILKKEGSMKKRALTLTGGILGTIVTAVITVLLTIAALGTLGLTATVGYAAAGVVLGVIMLIFVAFSVTALVLNAVSITAWNGDAQKYAKRRPVIITAVVFNLLLVLYFIYNMAVAGPNAVAIVESIIFIVGLALASIFYIVDLCNENKNNSQPVPPQQ